MEHNTHITSLQLSNSNMQKPSAMELAVSLRKNKTLTNLNIECNNIDSASIEHMAGQLQENPDSGLEIFKFNNQKHVGEFFGRPVEEALARLLENNNKIVKLGFVCNDPHWRDVINRKIM